MSAFSAMASVMAVLGVAGLMATPAFMPFLWMRSMTEGAESAGRATTRPIHVSWILIRSIMAVRL
jgi:hypothetical protein